MTSQPITTFLYNGDLLVIEFDTTQHVADGVECDLYSFVGDATKDLAIVRLRAGSVTPRQLVVDGDKTVEGHISGNATLSVWNDADVQSHHFPPSRQAVVETGQVMQWSAETDTVFYEVCEPPYVAGRFIDLN